MSRSEQVPTHGQTQSSNPVQHIEDQISNFDRWIGLREKFLDVLSGVKEDDVLNVATVGSIPEYGADPAAELKRALDLVKITAVDESGAYVDYAALKDSRAYQHYRNRLSPGLMGFDPTTLISRQERLAFWINMYKVINVASPFGGFDASGYGRSSGVEALHEYTQVKSVWVETAAQPNQPFGYAPSID